MEDKKVYLKLQSFYKYLMTQINSCTQVDQCQRLYRILTFICEFFAQNVYTLPLVTIIKKLCLIFQSSYARTIFLQTVLLLFEPAFLTSRQHDDLEHSIDGLMFEENQTRTVTTTIHGKGDSKYITKEAVMAIIDRNIHTQFD